MTLWDDLWDALWRIFTGVGRVARVVPETIAFVYLLALFAALLGAIGGA